MEHKYDKVKEVLAAGVISTVSNDSVGDSGDGDEGGKDKIISERRMEIKTWR